jgi:hypothetical protein
MLIRIGRVIISVVLGTRLDRILVMVDISNVGRGIGFITVLVTMGRICNQGVELIQICFTKRYRQLSQRSLLPPRFLNKVYLLV